MSGIIFYAFLVCLLHHCVAGYDSDLQVQTANGLVQGARDENNVRSFLGIPYAKPPTGDLRFAPPVAMKKFEDLAYGTKFSDACIQATPLTYKTPWQFIPTSQSDNCLTLNIWTPAESEDEKLPVMVWIHGGSFRYGSSSSPDYDGATLANKGKVIVVTMNYRLASLGFIYVNNNIDGNMGLLDQSEALKWTYNNIKKFGGDPKLITLFGESAGSISVGFHLVSPISRKFIKRAIMQSGSSIISAKPEQASGNERQLATVMSCKPEAGAALTDDEVAACVRKTKSVLLSDLEKDAFPLGLTTFGPRYGDSLIPSKPYDALTDMANNKPANDIQLLIGNMKDEGSMFLSMLNGERFNPGRTPRLNRSQAIKFLSDALGSPAEKVEPMYKAYVKDAKDEQDFPVFVTGAYRVIGDLAISCPTRYFADLYSKISKTFFYIIDYEIEGKPRNFAKWQGVAHYDEVGLIFGLPFSQPDKFTPNDRQMADTLITSWTTFARSGTPTLPNDKKWPVYKTDDFKYIVFNGDQITTKPNPQSQCIIDSFMRKYVFPQYGALPPP